MDGKPPHWKEALNKLATTLLMYGAAVLMTLAGIESAPVAFDISIVRRTLKTTFSLAACNLKKWLEIGEEPSFCTSTGLPWGC